jgi:hypothetical protein
LSTIKIWHPELKLVGESTTEAFTERNPFRLGGWVEYPATLLDATEILGRQIHDLGTLGDDELIRIAKTVSARKDEPAKQETIKAILARVGDDKALALAAKEAEQATDEPRSTLIADLDKVISA